MDPILVAFLAVLSGFVVAFCTGLFLGHSKARRLPGGSFSAGAMASFLLGPSVLYFIGGALLGLSGWVIYLILFKNSK